MKKLWARGCTADLVLAGPTMTHFTNFIRAQPREVQNRVHLLGFVPDAEKKDLLAAGDVFALPSRTDSFGIVYLEAWLYNKPVVGAHAGGVPEVIADGRDGFLVKFGDTDALAARIEQLLADRALAESFGRAGHAKVLASLTWDAVYARVRGVYGELVNK
jgi:glycosyltransferase involved in cell wall biosynthesis